MTHYNRGILKRCSAPTKQLISVCFCTLATEFIQAFGFVEQDCSTFLKPATSRPSLFLNLNSFERPLSTNISRIFFFFLLPGIYITFCCNVSVYSDFQMIKTEKKWSSFKLNQDKECSINQPLQEFQEKVLPCYQHYFQRKRKTHIDDLKSWIEVLGKKEGLKQKQTHHT